MMSVCSRSAHFMDFAFIRETLFSAQHTTHTHPTYDVRERVLIRRRVDDVDNGLPSWTMVIGRDGRHGL